MTDPDDALTQPSKDILHDTGAGMSVPEPTVPYIRIQLQDGPVSEVGVNGAQIDDVIEWARDALAHFNAPPYHDVHNERALYHLDEALAELAERTRERTRRGVEGTSTP